MRTSRKGIWPALGLFFLSPMVAEFLLGNLPIKLLGALVVLAPMYGGGALLVRETARRSGRGWPAILVLALAYGVVEEAFTTQTLFNPDYLHMNLHLLRAAYIPALGIGGWWTAFVLTLHTAWSISVPIALMEAAVPERATTPWLGRPGLSVTFIVLIAGCVANTLIGQRQDKFVASAGQLAGAGLVCALLVLLAAKTPRGSAPQKTGWVPHPWLVAGLALATGSAVLLVPQAWNWGAAAAVLALDFAMVAVVLLWSQRSGWDLRHKLALGAGGALAYAWHAFIETPVAGNQRIAGVRIGNALFAAGAVGVILYAAKQTRNFLKAEPAAF